jgi:hypothetical protein
MKESLIVPTEKRSLKYLFTDAELLIIGRYSAELHSQHCAMEDDKKRVVSDFSARLAGIEAEQGIAARKIASGYEHRNIECRVILDAPARGQKTLIRMDTEEASIEMMTDADRQLLIKFDEDNKPAPKPSKGRTVAADGTDEDERPRIESADWKY